MNIIYLVHLDWNWIKQRPQFMAEMIEKKTNYDIYVFYRKSFLVKLLTKNNCSLRNRPRPIFKLPLTRYIFILRVNLIMEYFFFSRTIKKINADIIYVTDPTFFPLMKHIRGKKIIYDCMDNMIEFTQSEKRKQILIHYEKELLLKTYLAIFSSEYLKSTVEKRAGFSFNSVVINNAIALPTETDNVPNSLENIFTNKSKRIISYIGTIADWFDYDTLVDIVKMDDSLVFYLFGPAEKHFPQQEGICFWGPQKRENIFYIMSKSDALIMPFRVNELIKSVNPVKLYEYIYSGKPVISVKYDETSVFKDYVYLYEHGDISSLSNLFNLLRNNNFSAKKSTEEAYQFALANTWESRIDQLMQYL